MLLPSHEDPVEHNQRSTSIRPVRDPRDSPLGGRCGDTTELDGSEGTIDIPPQLSCLPNKIYAKELFQLEEPRKKVR